MINHSNLAIKNWLSEFKNERLQKLIMRFIVYSKKVEDKKNLLKISMKALYPYPSCQAFLADCYYNWELYNYQYFDNKLSFPFIFFIDLNAKNTAGDYILIEGQSIIRIDMDPTLEGYFTEAYIKYLDDTLLHECVHQYTYEIKNEPGHGPAFINKCNEIGEQLDLPEVFYAIDPNCKDWPKCVRPERYYENTPLV